MVTVSLYLYVTNNINLIIDIATSELKNVDLYYPTYKSKFLDRLTVIMCTRRDATN